MESKNSIFSLFLSKRLLKIKDAKKSGDVMKKVVCTVIILVFLTACLDTDGEPTVNEEIVPATTDYSAYEGEYQRMLEEIRGSFTEGEKDGSVAVLRISGILGVEDVLPITKKLRELEEDDTQGLILWIDSPGGSVAAVTQMTYEILRFKESKPVVAYIGGYGASGAYYISSVCDTIVAREDAIVGSIGVIYVHLDASEYYRQYGFTFDVIKTGEHKDSGADWRSLTDEERAGIKASIADAFNRFVFTVATGRGIEYDAMKGYIDGSTWDAKEAASANLIDVLGNFDTAVHEITDLTDLVNPELIFIEGEYLEVSSNVSGSWDALRYQLLSTIRRDS
jgi:protease-4